jgi:hypothetical protein
MKPITVLAFFALFLFPSIVTADIPKDIIEASEAADGVIIGLQTSFGTGAYPYMEFYVLEVLKGPDPGEKLAVYFPTGTVANGDPMAVLKKHGSKFIIAYDGPIDKNGRFTYAGPKFDSVDIIATQENADKVKPGSFRFKMPSFEEAVRDADVIASAVYVKYEPNKALNKLHFRIIVNLIKGDLPGKDITVTLGGAYLHWLTLDIPAMQEKINPLLTIEPRLLMLKKEGDKLYYANPKLTHFPATPANLDKIHNLLKNNNEKLPNTSKDKIFDWTWWIVGAIAAIVAFFAAIIMSKVDYKYDRRRERLEKLRRGVGSDTDTGKSDG